jgi:diguanylate cyclase (GGDEF)-like protein
MEDRRGRSLWPLWWFSAAMAAGACALLVVVGDRHPIAGVVAIPWYVLAAAFALVELHPLYFQLRGETHAFGLFEIVLVGGLFMVSPLGLVAAEMLGCVAILGLWRRIPLLKLVFNVSQLALGTLAAVAVFRTIGATGGPLAFRSWLAALAGSATSALVGALAVAIAITVAEGRIAFHEVRESVELALAGALVNTMLGLVGVIILSESMLAALLLTGPILVVFASYRAYMSEHAKSARLQFLYRASEIMSGARDFEDGLVALLDFARDTFHAEIAEVVLRGEAGEPVGFRTCTGPGERQLRLEAVDRALVEGVIEVAGGATSAVLHEPTPNEPLALRDGLEITSAIVATLADEDGAVHGAVIVARARGTILKVFAKDELDLFDTFAKQLATTMERTRLSSSLAQLRVLKQELQHQAHYDSLTGLANRALFREQADAALTDAARRKHSVAMLFIDLDDFKTVNDTMGHAAGDALLEEVARRIESSVGELGTAARLGGDEFAVVLPQVSNDSVVRTVADRILVALGDPVPIEGQSVVAQASIGIATHIGAADADELMQHADVAMYTAKRNGKGRFDEFEPNMSLTVARRHQLKMGLERAIANDEFVLHYQPVIDMSNGEVSGIEALLRWKDPERGLMPPTEFVGVAEETGLIVPIGRFVLREACRQAAEWERVSPGLRMFVNLSTRQLSCADIVADVRAAYTDAGLDPSLLTLEVTETAMMQDIDEAQKTLYALKALGVDIAIDDFGTGFSSLSYLRQLPIDVLKIAKPIVDAISESPQDAAFVKGIIELGHVVGMKVVAEGVEQVEQVAHLVDMSCDFVQGYFYAASMDSAALSELLGINLELPAASASLHATG